MWTARYKHSAPPELRATWTARYKHSAPLELERRGQRATNIQLLWSWSDVDNALQTFSSSGAGAMWTARYKHSAPPELERCGHRANNIQLLRSWSDVDSALQTFSSSGAEGDVDSAFLRRAFQHPFILRGRRAMISCSSRGPHSVPRPAAGWRLPR